MAKACEALGKKVEAAREYEVAAAVQPKLDRQWLRGGEDAMQDGSPEDLAQRGDCWLAAAKLRYELGDTERALNLLDRIRREAAESSAAKDAETLLAQWRGK
jgi:tetratricopeptide (TPR) repeat protein